VRDAGQDHPRLALRPGETVRLVEEHLALDEARLAGTATAHGAGEIEIEAAERGALEDGLSGWNRDGPAGDGEPVQLLPFPRDLAGAQRDEPLDLHPILAETELPQIGGDRVHHRLRAADVGARLGDRAPVEGAREILERDPPLAARKGVGGRLQHVAHLEPRMRRGEPRELLAEDDVPLAAVRVEQRHSHGGISPERRAEDGHERRDPAPAPDEQKMPGVLRGLVGEVARRTANAKGGPRTEALLEEARRGPALHALDGDHPGPVGLERRRAERVRAAVLDAVEVEHQRQELPRDEGCALRTLQHEADRVAGLPPDLEHTEAPLAREELRVGRPGHVGAIHRSRRCESGDEHRDVAGESGRARRAREDRRQRRRDALQHGSKNVVGEDRWRAAHAGSWNAARRG
jgi:hypothetical protein